MKLNAAQHSYYLSDKKLTAKNDSQKKTTKTKCSIKQVKLFISSICNLHRPV